MAETKTAIANVPVWADLGTPDPPGAQEFYGKIFGWKVEVNPDPQYGGYAMGTINGKSVAGIGPKMAPMQPTAWVLYIGTDDADATVKKAEQAGGKVLGPVIDVGDQGRMATIQDPIGAAIGIWQPKAFANRFPVGEKNTFGWAELNGRGVAKAVPFYQKVFGWAPKLSPMQPGSPPYTEFQVDGESVAGGMELQGSKVPENVPNFWMVYFSVDDVDKAAKNVSDAGGKINMPAMDFPGGRFAVVADPQGAVFGLLKMNPR